MTGFTRDEYRFFAMAMNEDLSAVDVAGVAAAHGVPLDAYRAAYPGASDADLYILIQSDAFFRIPSMWCAQEHPGRSWCYELTWPTPVFGGALGACHLLDVPLTFGNFHGPMAAMFFGDSLPPEAVEPGAGGPHVVDGLRRHRRPRLAAVPARVRRSRGSGTCPSRWLPTPCRHPGRSGRTRCESHLPSRGSSPERDPSPKIALSCSTWWARP